jgi:hypothetical protein
MRKTISVLLVLILTSFVSLAAVRPAHAGISGTPTWILPVLKAPYTDPVLGSVNVAYVNGSTWTINMWILNTELNSTGYGLQIHVLDIVVWFDWNKNYSTTFTNVFVENGASYLLTASGPTELVTTTSNLFTHSYIVYVEFQVTYQSGGTTVTENRVWTYYGSGFAVLSQDQFNAAQASSAYSAFKGRLGSFASSYAQSLALYQQAEGEAAAGVISYNQGAFTAATTHYNSASNLLNQSWNTYISTQAIYDDIDLNSTKANLDLKRAQIDATEANATARLVEANGIAAATVVNSIAFVFFGLGFILIGVATIYYARRPRTTT